MTTAAAFFTALGVAFGTTAVATYGSADYAPGYYRAADLGECAGNGGTGTRQHPDSLCNRQNGSAAGSSG